MIIKRSFGAARPSLPHRPPHGAHGSSVPPRAPRRQAEHGAAWRWLVLDRHRRMGGSAQGCPGVQAAWAHNSAGANTVTLP